MLYRALPQGGVKHVETDSGVYRLKRFKYNSHYWILQFLSKAPRPSRILDIGAADGYLGAILKEQGHYLAGVESDPALAHRAGAHYDEFHAVDVEGLDISSLGQFDFILLADVLEHLRDPAALLRRALSGLRPGGEMIISLPNVAHLYVRLSLLFGRFEYNDRGILDRTHLRFFTLASMARMLQKAGCRIVELKPTPVPVQLILPWTERPIFAPFHECHFLGVRCWKTLLAYQFVIRAVPVHSARSSR
jgi:2-polyprenyl-3-methyl-5-hydroxy-6-metoxy-1,4-benzoquinol methylase